MNTRTVINSLVSALLVNNNTLENALYFHLDCSMDYYAETKPHRKMICECRYLHLVYHREQSSRIINVFSATATKPVKNKEIKYWTHQVSHNHLWIDNDAFNNLFAEMKASVNLRILDIDATHPYVATNDITQNNYFCNVFNDNVFSWIPVKVEPHNHSLQIL